MDGPKEQKLRNNPPQDRLGLPAVTAVAESRCPDSTTATTTADPETPTCTSAAPPKRVPPSRPTTRQRTYSPKRATTPSKPTPWHRSLSPSGIRKNPTTRKWRCRSDDLRPPPHRTSHLRRDDRGRALPHLRRPTQARRDLPALRTRRHRHHQRRPHPPKHYPLLRRA